MDKKYSPIFERAIPYLQKGLMKDFVVHTEGVVKAMEMIIAGEGGDADILIPSAILHDVGFSRVDADLQTNADLEKKREAQRQHLILAKEIIEEILGKVGYNEEKIAKIVGIVQSHKFQDPAEKDRQMLIDADNLSDTFKKQFYTDAKAYKITPERNYEFRSQNTYYSKTAQEIADIEMAKRKQEIFGE